MSEDPVIKGLREIKAENTPISKTTFDEIWECFWGLSLLLIGIGIGGCIEDGVSKTEAVRAGHAEWIPNAEGWSTFRWKEVEGQLEQ